MAITTQIKDTVAIITMDDGKANACGGDMLKAIDGALNEAEAAGAKAIVFAGRAGKFCGGFDLRAMTGASAAEVDALVNQGGHVVLRMFSSRLPIVVACTGHAVALGAVWLLAADTRIGAKGDFKIGLNETAINMVLPTFGVVPAMMRLHPNHITPAVIQATLYSPEQAVEVGYLDELVDEANVLNRAIERAAQLGELPNEAYAGTKLAVRGDAIAKIKASLS